MDVVTAATSPPVCACVSAFNVISERLTVSLQGPVMLQPPPVQSRQNFSVCRQQPRWLDARRIGQMRRRVGQHEGRGLALADRKAADGLEVLATQRDRRLQPPACRQARNGAQLAVPGPGDQGTISP